MPGPARHLAAIRSRLISSPELVSLLATTPAGSPAVYIAHIYDIRSPRYPLITLRQVTANMNVWATRMIDPGRVLLDFFSKNNPEEPLQMEELAESLLHVQKTLTSSNGACFHEIRKVDWSTAIWEGDTGAWRASAVYQIRVSLL